MCQSHRPYEDSYGSDNMAYGCSGLEEDFNEEEESADETNIYLNDPEHFEYDCYGLEAIDWIMERKCERLIEALRLQEPVDALLLLKKFKWNVQRVIDIYEEDRPAFWQTYFSDNNNNNDVKANDNCSRYAESYCGWPWTHVACLFFCENIFWFMSLKWVLKCHEMMHGVIEMFFSARMLI